MPLRFFWDRKHNGAHATRFLKKGTKKVHPCLAWSSCNLQNRQKALSKMRWKDFSRAIDFDTLHDGLDRLQNRIAGLRDAIPSTREVRQKLPSYRDIKRRLPFVEEERRGYGLPTAVVLGGIAAIGLFAIGSIALREVNRQVPKNSEDMT